MVAARNFEERIIPLDLTVDAEAFNPFAAVYVMAAWVEVRQVCHTAVTATVWEFLAGILALREVYKTQAAGRVMAIIKVIAKYPELSAFDTAPRGFDIKKMLGF